MIRALLWDLDGVVVDSGRYHYEAYRDLLSKLGRDLEQDAFLDFFGRRNDDIIRSLFGDLSAEQISSLSAEKEEIFRSKIVGRTEALPGALALMRKMKAGGKRQAIVSSTPRVNLELILDSLGVRSLLQAIVGEEDVTLGKPDPQGFLLGAKLLETQPAECLVLEDAPAGVTAAKRAGIPCIAVATTQHPDSLADADLVVGSLEEPNIQEFLERLSAS